MSLPVKIIHHQFDSIIIGAGGAGLMAALTAAKGGLRVAVITKVNALQSHTAAAQGGINAPLGNFEADDWKWLMYDTVRGSDWLADQDSVEFMCKNAAEAVLELERMGLPFTRDASGRIYQRPYGGQSLNYGQGGFARRACAVADRTGHAMLHTLYQQTLKAGVKFFSEFFALDLIGSIKGVNGTVALEIATGNFHIFQSNTTILATGGFGYAYSFTTSSTICTGDGNAMAYRLGVPLKDMEFVQFHPTGMYGIGCLVTEGARAEGAYLLNRHGERFMERYAPGFKELASRDIISRAIMAEIAAGNGCGAAHDHVHLSLEHLKSDEVRRKLPSVLEGARTFKRIDALKQPIPVTPAVHYTMGGIPTDMRGQVLQADNTPVPGLLAVGEAACNSVHGANRLGCNSLLDLAVFGREAGILAIENNTKSWPDDILEKQAREIAAKTLDCLQAKPDISVQEYKKLLKETAFQHAGILRDQETLTNGLNKLQALHYLKLAPKDKSCQWNLEFIEVLELINMYPQVKSVLMAAEARRESRGAHYRTDYPVRDDDEYFKHSMVHENEVTFCDVRMNTREVSAIPPEKRSY